MISYKIDSDGKQTKWPEEKKTYQGTMALVHTNPWKYKGYIKITKEEYDSIVKEAEERGLAKGDPVIYSPSSGESREAGVYLGPIAWSMDQSFYSYIHQDTGELAVEIFEIEASSTYFKQTYVSKTFLQNIEQPASSGC